MRSSLHLLSILTLGLMSGVTAFAQCQHPYCDGPMALMVHAPRNGPPIYNPQYCYQGNCYPGAYVNGAIDKEGHVVDSSASPADQLKQELAQVGVERFTATGYKPGLVRHIVLFRYATGASREQRQEITRRFLALKTDAKRDGRNYIVSITSPAQLSGEGVTDAGFIVTFKSQGDRNYYVGQPIVTDSNFYDSAHQGFKDFVGPFLDTNGAMVFDFSANK